VIRNIETKTRRTKWPTRLHAETALTINE